MKQQLNEELRRMQKLARIITEENNNSTFKINQYKDEALSILEEFIDEFEPQGLFEFIPNLEDYYINSSDNSLNIDELGSVYLIPDESPIPNEVEELMMDSNDGEINEYGTTWKKYLKNGYYYIVIS